MYPDQISLSLLVTRAFSFKTQPVSAALRMYQLRHWQETARTLCTEPCAWFPPQLAEEQMASIGLIDLLVIYWPLQRATPPLYARSHRLSTRRLSNRLEAVWHALCTTV